MSDMPKKTTRMIPGALYKLQRGGKEYFSICRATRVENGRATGLLNQIGFSEEWVSEGTEACDAWEMVGSSPWTMLFPVKEPKAISERQEPGNEDAGIRQVQVPAISMPSPRKAG